MLFKEYSEKSELLYIIIDLYIQSWAEYVRYIKH